MPSFSLLFFEFAWGPSVTRGKQSEKVSHTFKQRQQSWKRKTSCSVYNNQQSYIIVIFKCKARVSKNFHKEQNCKWFELCRPQGLSCRYLTLTKQIKGYSCVPIKLYLQKEVRQMYTLGRITLTSILYYMPKGWVFFFSSLFLFCFLRKGLAI